uniref:Pre-rRNA-processing protein Ipi1 N-terminal domain-containing protein n=1 Tax=Clastoptera arizonana TaxID=38151 RepID=A0A1B6D5G6_9HEMI
MGKAGYKHFKKAENSKVKLKGTKKVLPKGLNVTDTNFKIKKIILQDPLKKYVEGEILSKKHLNLQELLSRLKHHNSNMKLQALSGLNELITYWSDEILRSNLQILLEPVVQLSLERDCEIRKNAVKFLAVILKKVSTDQIAPFYSTISSHVICAMTHIVPAIREDSLLLLDTMIDTIPELTAQQGDELLPHFLDLISNSGRTMRSLSLHLEGKITTDRWRSQVFARLRTLLSLMLKFMKKEQQLQSQPREIEFNRNEFLYLNLYRRRIKEVYKVVNVSGKIKDHAIILMPLLLDTFVEVLPQNKNGDDHTISTLAAALLQCILDIIHCLWDILSQSDSKIDLQNWFQVTFSTSIACLLQNHFPYSSSQHDASQKNTKIILKILNHTTNDVKCILQNLTLCFINFEILNHKKNSESWTKCLNYSRDCLINSECLNSEECLMLRRCLKAISRRMNIKECASLFDDAAGLFLKLHNSNPPIVQTLFNFLSEIAQDRSLRHLHSLPNFKDWLGSLPELLTKKSISISTVNTICRLSSQNIEPFLINLDGWIEYIIDNLPSLVIFGDEKGDAKKKILFLLYKIRDWDEEMIENLNKAIEKEYLGPELTSILLGVFKYKLNFNDDQDEKIIEMIRNMSCLKSYT